MKKNTFFLWALLCLNFSALIAQDTLVSESDELTEEEFAYYEYFLDSVNQSLNYEYGTIELEKNGLKLAELVVPEGYKYLNPEQTAYILTDIWGNPPSDELGLGMLFPKDISPVSDSFTFGVEIDYSGEGYIDDEDAASLDYDELLAEMQSDAHAINEKRVEMGYERVELVGWATPPYYDATTKKLYWAKELRFGDAEYNTLNYNIRILGRGGYINLNAIGDMDVLPIFEQDIDAVLASVDFVEGQKYSNFNPDIDKVAAYGVGGLIAGKVLAKAGFFALLLKFWKFIALGLAAVFVAIKRFFFGEPTA